MEWKEGEGSRGLATETTISSRWAGSYENASYIFGPHLNLLPSDVNGL
jgi:hypothetical protein